MSLLAKRKPNAPSIGETNKDGTPKKKLGRPHKRALTGWEKGSIERKAATAARAKAELKQKEKDFKDSVRELGLQGEVLPPLPLKFGTPELSREAGAKGHAVQRANKPWREALDRAIIQSDGKTLRALAEALIKRAKRGDVQALKEIGDRLDGKAIQQVEAKVQAIVHVMSDDVKL